MTLKYAKPELLSPAGTLKNMRYAFAYGADAVYAGQPRYSLRVRNNEFNHINSVKNYMWLSTLRHTIQNLKLLLKIYKLLWICSQMP